MKRRGFLGLLTSLPFIPKVAELPPLPWNKPNVPIPDPILKYAPDSGISFANDPDTGIYHTGANTINIVVSERGGDL